LLALKALAVVDANDDGIIDFLAVQAVGAIVRISNKNEGQSWDTAEIARVPDAATYHPRYVTPEVFRNSLRSNLPRSQSPQSQDPGLRASLSAFCSSGYWPCPSS
jgi:hypothetical protein